VDERDRLTIFSMLDDRIIRTSHDDDAGDPRDRAGEVGGAQLMAFCSREHPPAVILQRVDSGCQINTASELVRKG
jgi:hypothetical protein